MDRLASFLASQNLPANLRLLDEKSPNKIPYLFVPGQRAIPLWKSIHAQKEQLGYYPLILGDAEHVELVQRDMQYDATPDELLHAAHAIDPIEWIRTAQLHAFEETREGHTEGDLFASIRGKWPEDAEPNSSFYSIYNPRTRNYHEQVGMAFVPTTISWQVPTWLGLGGWNECPAPAEHAAIFRYWQEQYQAEIICHTSDVIELYVFNPPRTREAALALAREHYGYCPDSIDQGAGSLNALAASLLYANAWFFWWD